MLSSSNTISDIQNELENGYAFYGYADSTSFDAALTNAVVRAQMRHIKPQIGSSYYEEIKTKDKIDLTVAETSIYYAELNFAISEFLGKKHRDDDYSRKAQNETFSAEGYSQSLSGASMSGKLASAARYFSVGVEFMAEAGYDMTRIERC